MKPFPFGQNVYGWCMDTRRRYGDPVRDTSLVSRVSVDIGVVPPLIAESCHVNPHFDGVQTQNWTNFPILAAICTTFASQYALHAGVFYISRCLDNFPIRTFHNVIHSLNILQDTGSLSYHMSPCVLMLISSIYLHINNKYLWNREDFWCKWPSMALQCCGVCWSQPRRSLAILVRKIRKIIANYGYEAKKLTNKFTVQKIETCDIQKLSCNWNTEAYTFATKG